MPVESILILDREMLVEVHKWGAWYTTHINETPKDKQILDYLEKFLRESK